MPCGYTSLFPDGRIIKLNRTLASWLGREAQDLVGTPFSGILSFGGRIAFETHLAPMLRLQGKVDEIALDIVAAGGTKIPMIATAVEKRDLNGRHLLTRVVLLKAIERRRYERNLVIAKDQAEAAILAEHETAVLREQFIAVLGHDLRNPIASIGAGVHLLGKDALSDRGRFILHGMDQSVTRAARLIDDVLDLARGRLGQGLVLTKDTKAPLTPVLEQVVAEVRSIVPDRQIDARFAIAEPLDCDRQRLAQLAANLISNAVTHGARDAPIEVEASCESDEFIFSVTNGGAAIPPEALGRLFQPFFRAGDRPSQQGLGLGLYIVSEIAKAHGGRIDVTSSEIATRFAFSMPLERG